MKPIYFAFEAYILFRGYVAYSSRQRVSTWADL